MYGFQTIALYRARARCALFLDFFRTSTPPPKPACSTARSSSGFAEHLAGRRRLSRERLRARRRSRLGRERRSRLRGGHGALRSLRLRHTDLRRRRALRCYRCRLRARRRTGSPCRMRLRGARGVGRRVEELVLGHGRVHVAIGDLIVLPRRHIGSSPLRTLWSRGRPAPPQVQPNVAGPWGPAPRRVPPDAAAPPASDVARTGPEAADAKARVARASAPQDAPARAAGERARGPPWRRGPHPPADTRTAPPGLRTTAPGHRRPPPAHPASGRP